jgi:hypothetical protein
VDQGIDQGRARAFPSGLLVAQDGEVVGIITPSGLTAGCAAGGRSMHDDKLVSPL